MVTSAAAAGVKPKPAVNAVAPVAASTCLRLSPFPVLVMSFLPEFCSVIRGTGSPSLLLHAEFFDCSRNVVHGLCDDLPQCLRGRGFRQRAALFNEFAVFGRRHDRD